jgi:hypothetical protein
MVLGMMEEATIININKLREIYDKRGVTLTHNFTKKYSRFWPEWFFLENRFSKVKIIYQYIR